ncbi:hypothetical protein R69746_02007 [Paraburkholderia aspalathi]|nr:hypothetical protein R69746_02007 [Paraburkholderia aspalathi]
MARVDRGLGDYRPPALLSRLQTAPPAPTQTLYDLPNPSLRRISTAPLLAMLVYVKLCSIMIVSQSSKVKSCNERGRTQWTGFCPRSGNS